VNSAHDGQHAEVDRTMTGPTYDDRSGAPGPGGEPYPGAGGPGPASATTVQKRTRGSGIWVVSIAAVVVLLLLLIFILQNGEKVKINIFGANPTLPLGVALLLAAVLGALLVALVGAARMVQVRRTARKARKSR
jgi:uncharacterized integral membrane protein